MKQILVEGGGNVVRLALLEQNRLAEVFTESGAKEYGVGSVYKGRVVNVLPGMQAAFVDIGHSRNAFLYRDDLLPAHLEKQPKEKPSIQELVQEGQELVVQVSKEAIGTKGARVTTHIALPGRWLVYMPEADYVGVSRKIEDEAERLRLKELAEQLLESEEGLIVRTVAEGENESALLRDLQRLRGTWREIIVHAKQAKAPRELYSERNVLRKWMRDLLTSDVEEIIAGNEMLYQELCTQVADIAQECVARVRLDNGGHLFDRFGAQKEMDRIFKPKIWLDNGGYLMIDHTEALTVIDVNTGKFTGTTDLEETVYATNMEAAETIARVLRLRDIGGIVIVDFIDMLNETHKEAVRIALEHYLKKDRTKVTVVGWTKLGLLELTRKKVREHAEPLERKCPQCQGTGWI
ncbi:hypothetical protein XYCOK13_29920 [Xylanibacillus composti]|uniref:S1 motif domain-containing protein n=1 Tax=Xylanibacillus composti TaxID=1572762 RepID=A0A8J4H399_9BACL|nr:Rne/Rng family ribonuclease [Xylanibacillus composti]GIQ70168.1 hypothetical protein XYCOK13_29920 [Xylanibacillus composti]